MDNSAQEPSISERQPQSRQSGVVLHTVRVSILTHGMQLLDLPEPQGDGAVVSALLSDVEHVTRSPRPARVRCRALSCSRNSQELLAGAIKNGCWRATNCGALNW
ncbi:unnamed protein product [Effrenium voratum]|nr:unnamed protein product [Effrenium voratum]